MKQSGWTWVRDVENPSGFPNDKSWFSVWEKDDKIMEVHYDRNGRFEEFIEYNRAD